MPSQRVKKIKGISTGESITFEAQLVSGKPGYTYQWSLRKEGEDSWSSLEGDGSS